MIELSLTPGKNKLGQISGDDYQALHLVRENFSIANPAYRSNLPYIQSRIYSITPTGKFELGLLGNIIGYLELNHYEYNVKDDLLKEYKPGYEEPKVKSLNLQYRDYQEASIIASMRQGRGVTLIPTAGGKTLICAGLIESLRDNLKEPEALTLVIVPTLQLVEQTASDFISYGLNNVTKWSGDNKPDPKANIIVAGSQILLSDKTDLSILADVKILLIDECHILRRGNQINKILNFIKTPFKFGFTGTMPSLEIDQWNIIGKLGPITYEQKTDTLKKQTYVSNFQIIILNIKHDNTPRFSGNSAAPTEAYHQELDFLINNSRRNQIISKLADKLTQNTLIMVDRINHGEILFNELKKVTNKPIYFIRGSTEIEDRENIRALMDQRNDIVVIAISKIFSTGINIPNLHNIIFASAGKAKIKIMQSIGRALRLHPTKKLATIFDIADNTKYGIIHLKERKKLYQLEKYEYQEKKLS
jgi:superfamily II DNA or RNA helicase